MRQHDLDALAGEYGPPRTYETFPKGEVPARLRLWGLICRVSGLCVGAGLVALVMGVR